MTQSLSLSSVFKPQAGWYRGDFHAHTYCSDGFHSPPQLVEVAKAAGVDFFTITDHNTIEAFPQFGEEPGILIIPGIEVTLTGGHFNVFGLEGGLDWLEDICLGELTVELAGKYQTTTELMRQMAGQGLLSSINHPFLEPWEWQDRTTDLSWMHCLEIWNDPSWPLNRQANPQAITLWTEWLKAGYRMTAIGGSDYHRPAPRPGEDKPAEQLGLPSTYVYASELSGAAILAGLRQRQAYVSMGPQVTFRAQANGLSYEIGADLGELSGVVEFTAMISGCPAPASAWIVKNGRIMAETPVAANQASLDYSDQVEAAVSAWYRLDVFDQHGQMLAITNPIFVGPRRRPEGQSYGDFVGAVLFDGRSEPSS